MLQDDWGNSADKLRHPRSDAYSAEHVLPNKQQIWCGGAYLDCYQFWHLSLQSVQLNIEIHEIHRIYTESMG